MNDYEIAAAEARQLLNNQRFQQAFANVRESIVAQLESTPIGNDVMRTELVVSLQVLKVVQADIERDISNALIEEY